MQGKFSHSFKPVVKLKPDGVCEWKKHGYGAVREVLGYLNKLAANDSERFVYPTVPNIVKHCKKYGKGVSYKQRLIEYVLVELQNRQILSKRVERMRNGIIRSGFIMVAHDTFTVRRNGCCELKKDWQVAADLLGASSPAKAKSAVPSAVFGAVFGAVPSAVQSAVSDEEKCGIECGMQCGIEPSKNPINRADSNGGGKSCFELSREFPAPNLEAGQPREPREPRKNRSDNPNPPHTSLSGLTDKNQRVEKNQTIQEYFGSEISFEWISDGEMNEIDKPDEPREKLLECCREAVAAKANLPYLGRKTNGDLMADAMGLLRDRYGVKAPRCWYPVIKKLREGGPSQKLAEMEEEQLIEARWTREAEEAWQRLQEEEVNHGGAPKR